MVTREFTPVSAAVLGGLQGRRGDGHSQRQNLASPLAFRQELQADLTSFCCGTRVTLFLSEDKTEGADQTGSGRTFFLFVCFF